MTSQQSNDTGDVDGWSSDEFESYEAPSASQTLEIETAPQAATTAQRPTVTVRVGNMMPQAARRAVRASMSPDIQVRDVGVSVDGYADALRLYKYV